MATPQNPNPLMQNVGWIASTYTECAKGAAQKLYRNWIIIPASFCSVMLFTAAIALFGQAGFAGGLLAGLIQIALLTLYYNWLTEAVGSTRLRPADLIHFEYSLFSSIINVGFVIFVAQFILGLSAQSMTSFPILAIFSLAVSIVFNPVAEIIQQRRSDGLASLAEAYAFVQENWVEWFIPFVLMLTPWIWISPAGPLAALSQTDPLLPAAPLVWGAQQVGTYLGGTGVGLPALAIGVIIANWFMIFRSLLFSKLASSSRRKRAYQLKNR